jgi:threonine/homoserine/homoserine lactone efflux protein
MRESLLAFAAAATLIAMAPGPSTVVIMRESVVGGRRAGLVTTLGNEVGVLVWGLAAALGLSALLVASRLAYDTLRITGAVVLVLFGVRTLWRARASAASPEEVSPEEVAGAAPLSNGRRFRLGLVTNAANPKAGVFAMSFLPQFVPQGWSVPVMLVVFSVLWVLIDLLWYTLVVSLVDAAGRLLRRPAARRALERVSGVVLVGLGVRLAAESR